MWSNLPVNVQEDILEYSNYRQDIQEYFKMNVLPLIDDSFIKIENGCELCYVKYLNKKKFKLCDNHKFMPSTTRQGKYFSIYNLPNRNLQDTLGKLFLIIDNVSRFKLIISDLKKFETHKLTKINNELLFA